MIFGRRLESTNIALDVQGEAGAPNKRQKHVAKMVDHFWSRWQKEYLTSLQERCPKNIGRNSGNVSKDDVVIVYDEKLPRHLWRLARIMELVKGNDGVVRGAKVKLGKTGTIIGRPLNKLFPLEIIT